MLNAVLHPQLKLKYFQQHGWTKDWIKTAEGIVREEFEKYKKVPKPVSPSVCSCCILFIHETDMPH
jgi:hypothetical protein